MQKVIVIIGPTASGKSTLAIELAKKIGGEVISADSRQVYRGLNIGSGKVTKKEMSGVIHHLLDVENPKKTFTASDFVKLGRAAIKDISSRDKIPIICGGTGFYIDSLLGHISLPEVPPNPLLRKKLEKLTANELFIKLKSMDADRAKTIDAQNPVRLIRAIEIATELGFVPKIKKTHPLYHSLWIGINWPKEKLHERIHSRLLSRMKRGMIAEAKRLHASGLSYKRMEQLGLEYRSLARFLKDKINKIELENEIETGNRQYARVQMHYWKRNEKIHWLKPKGINAALKLIKTFFSD